MFYRKHKAALVTVSINITRSIYIEHICKLFSANEECLYCMYLHNVHRLHIFNLFYLKYPLLAATAWLTCSWLYSKREYSTLQHRCIPDNQPVSRELWGRPSPVSTWQCRRAQNRINKNIFPSLVWKPWSQPHPLGWTGAPTVSWTLLPDISVGPQLWGWMGANPCSRFNIWRKAWNQKSGVLHVVLEWHEQLPHAVWVWGSDVYILMAIKCTWQMKLVVYTCIL